MAFTRPAGFERMCKVKGCGHPIPYVRSATAGRPRTHHKQGTCPELDCPCAVPVAADGQPIPAGPPITLTGADPASGAPLTDVQMQPPRPFSSNPFGLDVRPHPSVGVPGQGAQLTSTVPKPDQPPPGWEQQNMQPAAPGPYVVEPDSMEGMLRTELAELNYDHPMARTLSIQALKLARAADMADAGDVRMVIASTKALQSVLNDIAGRDGGDDDGDDGPFGAVRAEVRHTSAY